VRNNNDLPERFLKFSVRIIRLANKLPKTPAGFAVASQLIKSGTSIGANYYEAQDASSRNDFLNKISISLREARETHYWLMVIKLSQLLPGDLVDPEIVECNEIISILVKSVKTTKKNGLK